jgi:uncharacterized membrane protein
MATLTAWVFSTPAGAEESLTPLEGLHEQGLVTVHDAATVTWPADRKRPTTSTGSSFAGTAALGGAFWGLLFGLVFFVPLLGMAAGAAVGAAAGGSSAFAGIDEDFIDSVRAKLRPGTSALFVLSSDAVLDQLHETFPGQPAELVMTNLSSEDEARLRDAFAD